MEARALAQFTSPEGPLSSLTRSSSVAVPELLFHSLEDHVLVFQDLGPLLTLFEYLATFSNDIVNASARDQETCRKIGSRIGEFFARLHSLESLRLASTATSSNLENPLTDDLILQVAVMPVKNHLLRYEIPDAQTLFDRVQADFQRAHISIEHCFTLGNFTPGAVLIAASGSGDKPLGIIDWAFSSNDYLP
jgi:hypothetical protein